MFLFELGYFLVDVGSDATGYQFTVTKETRRRVKLMNSLLYILRFSCLQDVPSDGDAQYAIVNT